MSHKVYVDNNRWRTILCFDWPMDAQVRLTKEADKSRVWVVNMNQINFNHLAALQRKRGRGCSRVVAFLPTGWTHASGSGGGGAKRYKDSKAAAVVAEGLCTYLLL